MARIGFLFSTKCNLSELKKSGLREPFILIQFAFWSINLTWFTEHDDFKVLLVSFISKRFIEDVSSRGRMPQMKTLIALFPCLKQLAILITPFALSSGESWYKLLVPHNIITFLKDENGVNHGLAMVHVALCRLLSHSWKH